MSNDRFLRALRCEPVDCTPVWLMRQAGRYLPEYNETRRRAGNFLNLCKSPTLACEVERTTGAAPALPPVVVVPGLASVFSFMKPACR